MTFDQTILLKISCFWFCEIVGWWWVINKNTLNETIIPCKVENVSTFSQVRSRRGRNGGGGVAGLERILADTVCDPTADPAVRRWVDRCGVALWGRQWLSVAQTALCLVPDPEETVPGAGGHGHAVLRHAQAGHPVVVAR